jgi:hypothetical protein
MRWHPTFKWKNYIQSDMSIVVEAPTAMTPAFAMQLHMSLRLGHAKPEAISQSCMVNIYPREKNEETSFCGAEHGAALLGRTMGRTSGNCHHVALP